MGRSDARRSWVLLAVLGELMAEAKVTVTQLVQVGVAGTHCG